MRNIEEIEEALSIDMARSDVLFVEDTRRLTGPSLLWSEPGAILQLANTAFPQQQVIDIWRTTARRVLDAVGWEHETFAERPFDGGINLAISAPMDQLYSAIFVVQTIWHFCAAELLHEPSGDFDAMVADLKSVMHREANPRLTALLAAGAARGLDMLCDDDAVSVGHGKGSQTWPVDALPNVAEIDWRALLNVPVALITGTNGKTTTTRLCAAIARAAGKVSGLTSTDLVQVGDDILDRGDYSGPGGARLLLRDERLEIACLEVARGGLLRRGLPTRKARVALVTNVAADHLGQYGVNTVPELARAKFAVHRGLSENGVLVLNADDPFVVDEAANTDAVIWWFALEAAAPQIVRAMQAGQPCAFCDDGRVVFFDGSQKHAISDVRDIPITMSGAARYNVRNVLGAVCVTRALGLEFRDIASGLRAFRSDTFDNPGRLNEFSVNGARIFVDFAHNPHSVAAVTETVGALPANRRFVLLSHAGDRSDADIRDVTSTALVMDPDYMVATELPDYLRGRESGEVSDLIVQSCLSLGMQDDRILRAATPFEGVEKVLAMVQPGDVALFLVLSDRDRVFALLRERSD